MRETLWLFVIASVSCRCVAAQNCTQTMPVIVLDQETRAFVPQITPDLLHAKVGSAEVPVTSVERITSFRLLILIDTSGSMQEGDIVSSYFGKALGQVKQTIDQFLGELPPGVSVEYGVFNNKTVFGDGFTSNANELRRSLPDLTNRLRHPGREETALYDAIHEGLAQFGAAQAGDSIVAVTDGGDTISKIKPMIIQEEAAAKDIRLFAIRLDPPLVTAEFESGSLFDFAERTGGSLHVVHTGSRVWMNDKYSEPERQNLHRFLTDEVLSGYLLLFDPPASPRKNRKWMLSVTPPAGQRHKMVAAYPSFLGPCPVTAAGR